MFSISLMEDLVIGIHIGCKRPNHSSLNRSGKRPPSMTLKAVCLLMSVLLIYLVFPVNPVRAEVLPNATVTESYVNFRASASDSSSIITKLYCGHRVQITGPIVNENWYPVKAVDLDGMEKQGFMWAAYILPDATNPVDPASEFEISIAGFPDSYKTGLRALNQKYPNWVFVPYATNLDFNTVVSEESKIGRSLIEKNVVDNAWLSTYTKNDATLPGWTPSARDAYNWLTDTYIVYDGTSRWVNASSGFVAYSLDPRNFLSDTQIFQFLMLSYDPSSQNIETVQSLLNGTFMESALIKNAENLDVTYAQTIMDASNTYQVNPYFLVARMKQEILLSDPPGQPCDIASGTYSGYKGYYNFYGIGATPDPTPKDSVVNALKYAKGVNKDGSVSTTYLRPWNSQYKAILGGAMWIENGYISETRGQDTLYFQRWDVVPLDGLYWHQYQTSTQAPVSEATRLEVAYRNIKHLPLQFKIPVYNNMPEAPVRPPEKNGNPNNWLTSITIAGHVITPSFDPNIFEYDLIVGSAVESVHISTTTASVSASVSGVGTRILAIGPNPITLTVTAQNGSVRYYTMNIIRLDPSDEPLFTSAYTLNGQFISGLYEQMTVETFIGGLTMIEGATAQYCDSLGNTVTNMSRIICTGDRLYVYDAGGILKNVFTIILYGDATGDGRINSYDLTSIARHIIRDLTLTEQAQIAADVDRSGRINSYDLTLIAWHVIKDTTLTQ